MRAMLAVLVMFASLAQPGGARAGAWPREPGGFFLSFSQALSSGTPALLSPDLSFRSYSSVYAEYGWSERVTIGFDGAYGWGPEADLRTGFVFARWVLGETAGGNRFAADLGLGRREETGEGVDARLRFGLAWGRGYERGAWGSGWLGAEGSMERLEPAHDTIYKADLTLGRKTGDLWMLILQLQSGLYPRADPVVRLAPSVARRIGRRFTAQLGLEASLLGERAHGVKFGTWISF